MAFTLIEVMMVVVIIAILAAVAVPSYQQHIIETNRSDARTSTTQIAAAQERFFFNNDRYATLAELGYGTDSQEGHYTIAIRGADAESGGTDLFCGSSNDIPCFKVDATAKLGTPQEKDSDCKTFTIFDNGRKQSKAKDNTTVTTEECW